MPVYENVTRGVIQLPPSPARKNGAMLCPRYWAPRTMPTGGVLALVMSEQEARQYLSRGQIVEVAPSAQPAPAENVVAAAEVLVQTAEAKAAAEAAAAAANPVATPLDPPAPALPKRSRRYAVPD